VLEHRRIKRGRTAPDADSMVFRRSRTRKRAALLAAFLVLFVLASGPGGLAFTGTTRTVEYSLTESLTLPRDYYSAFAFSLAAGDSLLYSVRVTAGGAIDVYFVPPEGLTTYATGVASTFGRYLAEEARTEFSGAFADPNAIGPVTVIIDNVALSGAQPSGAVTVALTLSKSSNLLLGGTLFILCGVAILAITAVILLIRRRKTAPRPQSIPYRMPPPTPYQTLGPETRQGPGEPPPAGPSPPLRP